MVIILQGVVTVLVWPAVTSLLETPTGVTLASLPLSLMSDLNRSAGVWRRNNLRRDVGVVF